MNCLPDNLKVLLDLLGEERALAFIADCPYRVYVPRDRHRSQWFARHFSDKEFAVFSKWFWQRNRSTPLFAAPTLNSLRRRERNHLRRRKRNQAIQAEYANGISAVRIARKHGLAPGYVLHLVSDGGGVRGKRKQRSSNPSRAGHPGSYPQQGRPGRPAMAKPSRGADPGLVCGGGDGCANLPHKQELSGFDSRPRYHNSNSNNPSPRRGASSQGVNGVQAQSAAPLLGTQWRVIKAACPTLADANEMLRSRLHVQSGAELLAMRRGLNATAVAMLWRQGLPARPSQSQQGFVADLYRIYRNNSKAGRLAA